MSPPAVHGNVVEYIADRLYLGTYTGPPNSQTPFPPPGIPDPYRLSGAAGTPLAGHRSPKKRRGNAVVNSSGLSPVYFRVDDTLLYNAFHHDFGPLHIGHVYRFAIQLHDILGAPENEGRVVVFWSRTDAKARANAACLLACYMILVQNWPPHLALCPLTLCDPPLQPFRDAGYSQADYILNVQDIVYGVWRAKEKGLVVLKEFQLDEYEKFERVDMGDFNWISPNFLAFASPQYEHPEGETNPRLPKDRQEILASRLPTPFKNVLEHFRAREIGLVVRLNDHLYPAEFFTALGITHQDMIFDDGTCPPLKIVRNFINMAHQMIETQGKNIAVHCKAGLGRTGCLIGAYLVYRYGFTANEVIAYMRFMRPGMVVGPQQHWLHINQNEFRQWWFEDTVLAPALEKHTAHSVGLRTPTKKRVSSTSTPTRRSILGEVDSNEAQAAALPAPTPGQPRKASGRYPASVRRSHPDAYEPLASIQDENKEQASPIRRKKSSILVEEEEYRYAMENGLTEEEYLLRTQKRSTASSNPFPKRSTRTSGNTPPEKQARASGSGISVQKVRSSPRRTAAAASGVRKTSGARAVSGSTPGRAL